MNGIGKRLEDEVDRLGGVTAVSARMATVRNTIYNWIQKENIPANRLAELGAAGADVLYILTGQRMGVASNAPTPALKPDEAALLDNYRHCPQDGKDALKKTSDALAQRKEKRSA